jgi:hypothetical protein
MKEGNVKQTLFQGWVLVGGERVNSEGEYGQYILYACMKTEQ